MCMVGEWGTFENIKGENAASNYCNNFLITRKK